jgi:hypothetical protein
MTRDEARTLAQQAQVEMTEAFYTFALQRIRTAAEAGDMRTTFGFATAAPASVVHTVGSRLVALGVRGEGPPRGERDLPERWVRGRVGVAWTRSS